MQNWKLYLMFIAPLLNQVSIILANKDTNDVGPDDTAAEFLHYAAVAITAIVNDQPLPTLPASLKQ